MRAWLAWLLLATTAHAEAPPTAPEEPGLELVDALRTPEPYLGIGWSGAQAAPASSGFKQGAVVAVATGPAGAAGIVAGDLLVQIGTQTLDVDAKELLTTVRAITRQLGIGAVVEIVVIRAGVVTKIPVTIGARPPRFDAYRTPGSWLTEAPVESGTAAVLDSALDLAGLRPGYEDTLRRLAACEERRDVFRLRDVTQAHVAPAASEAIAARIVGDLGADPLAAARRVLVPWMQGAAPAEAEPLAPADLESAVALIAARLERAHARLTEAYAGLEPAELTQLVVDLPHLAARLDETIYLHEDENAERGAANLRTLAVLERVRLAPLLEAADQLAVLVSPSFLDRLAQLCRASPASHAATIVESTCSVGKIVIGGEAATTYTADVAFRFDLGGDDRYRDCGGASRLGTLPISIHVDHAGDDLYGAYGDATLGAAWGGIAMTVDCAGDDQYLARRTALGAAVAGLALFDDRAGNDIYRGEGFAMGIALVGFGLLRDGGGDDRYAAGHLAQGVGLARGLGALCDRAGDDEYVCTGRRPSSYGEPGVYDGWGQGLGLGFRTLASGGIGVLADTAGRDRYEGGNFAQGGGYFYGMGILDDGAGDDRYIGSRYAQGFAAHQAVGILREAEGNDRYTSHHDVACGLSWDETMVVFHDRRGDDLYAATGFSIARAAHNGVVLFFDDAGDDRYGHSDGPAGAGGNDYHGGTSFALFVDSGGGRDTYAGPAADSGWGARPEHAVFLDLPGRREDLDRDALGGTPNLYQPGAPTPQTGR